MSGKKEEKLIKYISSLPVGARVSVRNLAKENAVSEGTAYKAIKTAEKLRLVETKQRSGTVRLKTDILSDAKTVTLSQAIGTLGLTVLAGEKYTDARIGAIVLGDGSLEQFKATFASADEDALCLVGDRPDLFSFLASRGVNMIVTGGAQPGEVVLELAEEHGSCVLSSQQDSYTVLNLLNAELGSSNPEEVADTADKWMRMPPYLYYNDMVIDWYNSYGPLFGMSSKHAVVDDSLKICGTVDATKAIAASTYTKISSLYEATESIYAADVSTPITEIARHMVSSEVSVAYITRNGELCGIVTANDVLRYYLMNSTVKGTAPGMPVLENISSDNSRSVYTMQTGEDGMSSANILMNIVNKTVEEFAAERAAQNGVIASGTFFVSPVPEGEIMLSCDSRQASANRSIVDIEMYDEAASYGNCMLVLSENGDN